MNLDRVTITGADDSVHPSDLLTLSVRYPFVEWGILVHAKGRAPRFPSDEWLLELKALQNALRTRDDREPMKLSLHLCGRWVRDLLVGLDSVPRGIEDGFDRIQLNFHAENTPCDPAKFTAALLPYGLHQIIFQLDGANGNQHMQAVLMNTGDLDVAPLYDISGGHGILPTHWPEPIPNLYMGYAGGLGPDNLKEQLPKIDAAANGALFWIDMETRVRSADDQTFDLGKVERCLQIAEPFITKVSA